MNESQFALIRLLFEIVWIACSNRFRSVAHIGVFRPSDLPFKMCPVVTRGDCFCSCSGWHYRRQSQRQKHSSWKAFKEKFSFVLLFPQLLFFPWENTSRFHFCNMLFLFLGFKTAKAWGGKRDFKNYLLTPCSRRWRGKKGFYFIQ